MRGKKERKRRARERKKAKEKKVSRGVKEIELR